MNVLVLSLVVPAGQVATEESPKDAVDKRLLVRLGDRVWMTGLSFQLEILAIVTSCKYCRRRKQRGSIKYLELSNRCRERASDEVFK